MKKILTLVCTSALILSFMGCATTSVKGSGIKGKPAKVDTAYTRILDYQGASFGSEIPQWVVEIGDGNFSPDYLKTVIPGIDGKKVFVQVARGDNLAFIQQWTDLVDIEVQVGDEMQRIVGKAVSAIQKARGTQKGSTTSDTELEQELNMYKEAVSAVELNGLEKLASYWIKKETKVEKNAKESTITYEYYTIWGMKESLYNEQLLAAMKNIEDNTDEGKALKAALTKKLKSMMITSNDESINEEAEASLED